MSIELNNAVLTLAGRYTERARKECQPHRKILLLLKGKEQLDYLPNRTLADKLALRFDKLIELIEARKGI